MKLSPGDEVVVKEKLIGIRGLSVRDEMKRLKGYKVTVDKVIYIKHIKKNTIKIKEDLGKHYWLPSMFKKSRFIIK